MVEVVVVVDVSSNVKKKKFRGGGEDIRSSFDCASDLEQLRGG